jgi:hypothetical protein
MNETLYIQFNKRNRNTQTVSYFITLLSYYKVYNSL